MYSERSIWHRRVLLPQAIHWENPLCPSFRPVNQRMRSLRSVGCLSRMDPLGTLYEIEDFSLYWCCPLLRCSKDSWKTKYEHSSLGERPHQCCRASDHRWLDRIGYSFESSVHRKSAWQPPMTMMLGKELLSGLWVRPECRSYRCLFHIRSCLTSCLTLHSFFTTLVATRRRRCLLRSVWVYRYALTAALCDLGDPGWRDPWFPHWALLLLSPSRWYGLCVFCWLSCCFAIPYWDDTRLSPLASVNPFHPWTGICHVAVLLVWVAFWFGCFCVFMFLCFVGFWCFASVWFCVLVMILWQYTGLRTGPSPVHFWGHSTADGLRMQ